ncbi:TonB-dependent siderophore receptor [Denitratisoma sp. DHT3]|nr:TonB-dependent siderophore receptor [Denitratisoma sp. DHT3]
MERKPGSFRTPAPVANPTAPKFAMTGAGLAFGLTTALFIPHGAHAESGETRLGTVKVTGKAIDPNPNAEPGVPYKAKLSGDERHLRPLAETPQTITVLTQTQLQDSGRSDLRDILRAQPGITLGTGENGNAFGDRYIIRGQEARSDVFVDGLRDPGMTLRESFVVDQIEITKGPSATFAGRGATGGAINSITKQATTDTDFTKFSAGIGTDSYQRFTVDANRALNDEMALRVNLLSASQDVPDRGPANRKRDGAALSFNYTPTDKFWLTADYYHLDAKDKPDLGTYFANGAPVKNIPVYLQGQDFLESRTDTYTLRLNYQARPNLRISNLTRYGQSNNGYVTTGARGSTFGAADPNAGKSTITLSSHQGWQDVDYFANQTNVYLDQDIAGLKHQFIFSLEYADHKVLNGNYSVANSGQNCITGNGASNNAWCVINGSGATVGNIRNLMNRRISKGAWDIDWKVKTLSLAAMDTVDLNDKWTLFGGLRYDRFDYDNTVVSGGTATDYKLKDGLWNGHLGVTYKFLPYANVYATYSTASDFNGGESDVGANCGYGGVCVPSGGTAADRLAMFARSKPELSENLEVGTKWNLFDGKLLATAAAFQVTKKDVMENTTSNNYATTGSINTGKYRVEGYELSLVGQLTDKLSTQAGLTIMSSQFLESQVSANVGKRLANFPKRSATALLNYQATPAIGFGGGVTYTGEKYSGSPESVAGNFKVPGYTVYDLFATYRINAQWRARLNVNNVTNQKYYLATYTAGFFTYLGDARNVRLTLNYDF